MTLSGWTKTNTSANTDPVKANFPNSALTTLPNPVLPSVTGLKLKASVYNPGTTQLTPAITTDTNATMLIKKTSSGYKNCDNALRDDYVKNWGSRQITHEKSHSFIFS